MLVQLTLASKESKSFAQLFEGPLSSCLYEGRVVPSTCLDGLMTSTCKLFRMVMQLGLYSCSMYVIIFPTEPEVVLEGQLTRLGLSCSNCSEKTLQ